MAEAEHALSVLAPAPRGAAHARARVGVRSAAWRQALVWLLASRLVVWGAGMGAAVVVGRAAGTAAFDPAGLTAPSGWLGNLALAPAARWDSAWYLSIAHSGYAGAHQAAFFPLYPLLVAAGGVVLHSMVAAGVLVSVAALALALWALHRLAELELGTRAAGWAVALCAAFPMSFFLSAIYSESLYLALSVGVFLAARHERWAWAGVLGGLAAASRSTGLLLAVAIVLLFLYGPRGAPPGSMARSGWARLRPRHPVTPALAWAALVPAGLLAFMGWLALAGQDPLAPLHAQAAWGRHLSLHAIPDAAVAAWHGLGALAAGSGGPLGIAGPAVSTESVLLFAVLLGAVIALAGVLRRLPLAYGAYAALALVAALAAPADAQPLMSLPRFVCVLFPFALWAGGWAARGRWRGPALVGAFSLALVLYAGLFASWRFVA